MFLPPFLQVAWGRLPYQYASVTPSRSLSMALSANIPQPCSNIPYQPSKTHVPHFTTTKPKSPPKPQSAEVITTPPQQPQDIIALKWAFPDSFNTIGNMSGTYTIRTNPSVTPVQHAWQEVPKEYQEKIECTLDYMVNKGVIAHLPADQVGIFPNIPQQAWWYNLHIPQP